MQHSHLNPAHHYPQIFIQAASRMNDARLVGLAGLAFLYSTLRFVEAYGLWHMRPWAEWLAIVAGSAYLPVEVYEMWRHATWMRGFVLLTNVVIVVYLVKVRVEGRRSARESGRELRAEGRREPFAQPLPEGRDVPHGDRVGTALLQVVFELLAHQPGERGVVDEEVDLLVQVEGAVVEVRRSTVEDPVDDHRLHVEHRGLVLEDLHAAREQRPKEERPAAFVAGTSLCSSEGTITRTSTPRFTARREAHRGVVRKEIGIGDPDLLRGRRHEIA